MSIGQHIDGWMSEQELHFLHDTAKTMQSVVEIGSYKGRSTYALCSSGCPLVTSVDPHWSGTFKEFITNLAEFQNLRYFSLCSQDADILITQTDMLFIDGNHEYESVKQDLELYTIKTTKLVTGHDYIPEWPGVIKAVNEFFGKEPDFVEETIWGYWLEGNKK